MIETAKHVLRELCKTAGRSWITSCIKKSHGSTDRTQNCPMCGITAQERVKEGIETSLDSSHVGVDYQPMLDHAIAEIFFTQQWDELTQGEIVDNVMDVFCNLHTQAVQNKTCAIQLSCRTCNWYLGKCTVQQVDFLKNNPIAWEKHVCTLKAQKKIQLEWKEHERTEEKQKNRKESSSYYFESDSSESDSKPVSHKRSSESDLSPSEPKRTRNSKRHDYRKNGENLQKSPQMIGKVYAAKKAKKMKENAATRVKSAGAVLDRYFEDRVTVSEDLSTERVGKEALQTNFHEWCDIDDIDHNVRMKTTSKLQGMKLTSEVLIRINRKLKRSDDNKVVARDNAASVACIPNIKLK
jgi:hypothetical protein